MDLGFMAEVLPQYIKAAGLTLFSGGIGILCSIVVGLLCSMIKYYQVPILRRIVGIYIELSRNTPLLIQLFFLYYGLPKLGITLSAMSCAIIGLTFLGGSYMAEAFRSGLEAVTKIQIESGLSIGLKKFQLMRYVVLPQAFGVAIPSLCANVIFLLKETSIFSAVALADLTFVAKDLIGVYYKTNEALVMLVAAYAIILLPLSLFFTWLERKVRYATSGR